MSARKSPFKRIRKKLYFRFLDFFSHELYEYGLKDSMFFSIKEMKRRGFMPKTVIDVGAYTGGWTSRVLQYYPDAKYILCEAQPDKQADLEQVKNRYPGQVEYHIGLLGSAEKEKVPYYLMETGSSVLEENTDYSRELTYLPMHTLDSLIDAGSLQQPCFLKLDVQGYEIEVLKGAQALLSKVDIILLEVSILEYNKGAPLIAEILHYMDSIGFSTFDITDLKRTASEHALFQADIFLCRHEHAFRTINKFS